MLPSLTLAALAATAAGAFAWSQTGSATTSPDDTNPVCKFVLASDPGALPYKLCQSKAQSAALEAQYAKDANRMVCHYEDMPGTKLGAHKICGPQSAWDARQQQAREMTEKIQMGTCVPYAGC